MGILCSSCKNDIYSISECIHEQVVFTGGKNTCISMLPYNYYTGEKQKFLKIFEIFFNSFQKF